MKKRLTLNLPPEVIKSIKMTAKAKNMTVSQFVERLFLEYITEQEAQTILKKVS